MNTNAVSSIQVVIAGGHRIDRSGLSHLLDVSPGIAVVGQASDFVGITQILLERSCDVLLLTISTPENGGIDILHLLKKREPMLRILVLSSHAPEKFAVRALKAGAAGYLTKDEAPDKLIEAVRVVARGRKYITDGMAESLVNHVVEERDLMSHQMLSDREFQTIQMIAAGHTRAQIAQTLSISPKTVSIYRTRALEKMGMHNNAQLTQYITKHALFD